MADSHLAPWAGKLNLLYFDPNTDSLRFGTSASSLTQEQVRMISVPGYLASSVNEAGFVKFVRDETPRGPDFDLDGTAVRKPNDGKERIINSNFVMDGTSTANSRVLVENLDPTAPLVMNGTVYLNGIANTLHPVNAVLSVSGPGLVEFRDTIAEAYLNFLSLYVRDGNVALFGSNTYTGDTTVAASTLRMGASNVLPDRSMLVLDNGILKTAGFGDIMRSLSVVGISAIDFGFGDSDLWFMGVGIWDQNGSLSLLNFDIGTDTLRFGSSAESLTGEHLLQIHLPATRRRWMTKGMFNSRRFPSRRISGLRGWLCFLRSV